MNKVKVKIEYREIRKIIDVAISHVDKSQKELLIQADEENFSKVFSQFEDNREKCEQVASFFEDEGSQQEYLREIHFKILQKTFGPLFAVANTDGMTFEYIDSFDQKIKDGLADNSLPNLYNSSERGLYQFLKTTYIFEQYRHAPHITIQPDDIFIDMGACFGDVSLWACQLGAKKAYAIEPDPENFALLQRNIEKFAPTHAQGGSIEAVKLAFGDKKETLRFASNISSSCFAQDGDISVEVTTFDAWCAGEIAGVESSSLTEEKRITPDFIKMDIEGAEPMAIKGARETITSCKPRLAISIYHNFSDLWEIPLMIYDICPEYSFFCKKHHPIHECILYAAILK